MPYDLSIVIVNWNGGRLLTRCIETIVSSAPKATYEIVIVDNNSHDDTQTVARALVDQHPGKVHYGSGGTASINQLVAELFNQKAGTHMTHVPYKGNTPAMTALMSGEVAMVFDPVLTSAPLVKSGRVRALAVTTAQRSALLPDVPTVAQAGVKGYEAGNWFGVFAPAGTPRDIVDRLNAAINRAMTRADMKDKLASQGADALIGTPAELAALVQRELAKFAAIIKAAGVRIE